MEKTAVVKEVKDLKKQDTNGNYSFIIKFDNGDEGFYRTKSDHADKFKVGESILYVFETLPKRDGTGTYNKVSLPKPAYPPQQGGGKSFAPKSAHQIKMESRTMLLRYAVDMFIAKIVDNAEVKITFLELCEMLDESIDKLGESK